MLQGTTPLTRALLAPNPGPMTLDGTTSYLVGARGSDAVVIVDPGPDDAGHIERLAAGGGVGLILVTHHHRDHTGGSAALHRLTGAPVRALDPSFCIGGAPLVDGELIDTQGTSIRVLATPGHTPDSVCFVLDDDGPTGSVLTGDTILGRGSTVIAGGGGNLAAYLASLGNLRSLGPLTVLPAHGPMLPDLEAICDAYLEHRRTRLDEVRAARRRLGRDATVSAVADLVYADIDDTLRSAAEHSVDAQLSYLDAEDSALDGTNPAPTRFHSS